MGPRAGRGITVGSDGGGDLSGIQSTALLTIDELSEGGSLAFICMGLHIYNLEEHEHDLCIGIWYCIALHRAGLPGFRWWASSSGRDIVGTGL
jgi:hypothetical protein